MELATSCQFVGDASSTISLSLSLSPSDILSVIRSLIIASVTTVNARSMEISFSKKYPAVRNR